MINKGNYPKNHKRSVNEIEKVFPPPQLQYKLSLIGLQKQRSNRLALWRSCLLVGCTMGLSLLATSSYWQIKDRTQIEIDGTKSIAKNTVYQSLNFDYDRFVWAVNGIALARKIESIPAVADASVKRQIIPPKIEIEIREKTPVALASLRGRVGLLTADGEWIEQQYYADIGSRQALPTLKAIDYQAEFQPVWRELYQAIALYPELKISEVHWQPSGSLFIQTKIGRVFLGSDSSRLKQQFKIMLELTNLNQHLKSSDIAYIDLSNSEVNLIQKY